MNAIRETMSWSITNRERYKGIVHLFQIGDKKEYKRNLILCEGVSVISSSTEQVFAAAHYGLLSHWVFPVLCKFTIRHDN